MAGRTEFPSRAWVAIFAGVCINLATGFLYSWSVFASTLTTSLPQGADGSVSDPSNVVRGAALAQGAYNWTTTSALAPYSLALLVFAFTWVFASRLRDKYSPRLIATVGGVCAGIGMIVASFSSFSAKGDHSLLLLGLGALTSMGIGLACASATSTAAKWFHPDRRRLIGSLVLGGAGLASVFTAPLTAWLLSNVGPSRSFVGLGVAFLIVMTALAQLLTDPPPGYVAPRPEGIDPDRDHMSGEKTSARDYDWAETAQTPQFYLVWLMYCFAAFAGLMMTGGIAKIALELVSPAQHAALASAEFGGVALASGFPVVVALAIGGVAGRPIIATSCNRFGRVPCMVLVFLAQATLVALALPNSHDLTTLAVVAVLIGATYGASLTLFPAATDDLFGVEHSDVNYAMIFTAWGVGGALGNYAAGLIRDATGTFTPAFYTAASLLVAAAILAVMVRPPAAESVAPETPA